MSTLEKIRAEIAQLQDEWFKETDGWWCYEKALQIIDKYAEQEPCDDMLTAYTMGVYAEREKKTGHWIEEDMFDGDVAYRCSECNELFWIESGTPKDNEYYYCPKCGKRLVEPQESEDKE